MQRSRFRTFMHGELAGGPLPPERAARVRAHEDRAAITVLRIYLAASVIAMLAYAAVFRAWDPAAYTPLAWTAVGASVAYAVAFAILRNGRTIVAGTMSQLIPVIPVMVFSWYLSAETGFSSLLACGALGAFVMIPHYHPLIRLTVGSTLVTAIAVTELAFTPDRARAPLNSEAAMALASFHRVLLAGSLLALAAVLHRRSVVSARIAEGAVQHIEALASTDPLTGISNRRPIMDLVSRASRDHEREFVVALVDLDHFKRVNDEFGHGCGDAVLRDVAKELTKAVRGSDIVGRWGGEEFLLILNDVTDAKAMEVLDRLRQTIRETPFTCGEHLHRVTVSIGVADSRATDSWERCLQHADAALYQAKESGRDQVVLCTADVIAATVVAEDFHRRWRPQQSKALSNYLRRAKV